MVCRCDVTRFEALTEAWWRLVLSTWCVCVYLQQMCDMDRLYEICDKHGLTVVEDCAHALGVNWRGTQLGNRAKVRFIQLRSFVERSVLDNSRWGGVKSFSRFSQQQRCQETRLCTDGLASFLVVAFCVLVV